MKNIIGKNNPNWKGKNISQRGIHGWLIRVYGQPNKCEKCGLVGKDNINWAKKRGKKYERKKNNFWRLCDKCHMNYDDVGKKSGLKLKGKIGANKGKHWKVKDTSKMKGKIPWNKGLLGFGKGHPAYNTKPNSGSFKKGQHPSPKTEIKKGEHKSIKTEFKKKMI